MIPKNTRRFFPANNDDFILIENGVKNNDLKLKFHKDKIFEFQLKTENQKEKKMASDRLKKV